MAKDVPLHVSEQETEESKSLLDTDEKQNDSVNAETKFLYISSVIVAFGFFTIGYDIGSISGSMVFITDYFSLTYLWHELLVSMAIGPAIFGALLSGYFHEIIGRKLTLMLSSAVFVIGSLVMACAFSVDVLLLGRILTGIGLGFSSITSNVYVVEFAPARIRGRLSCYGSVFVTGAMFSASLVSGIFSGYKTNGWRYMLGLGALPGLVLFFGSMLVPESPRWLISKGREQEAIRVLQKLRGTEDVDDEIYEIKHQHKLAVKEGSIWTILFRMLQDSNARKALLIACSIMAFQQLCGINIILYYTATIFIMSGIDDTGKAAWLGAAVTFTNFIFTFVAIFTVERFGRRKLLLTSSAGVSLMLVLLAITSYFEALNSPMVTNSRNSGHPCFELNSCNKCLYDQMCGFCYMNGAGAIHNASCVPLENFSSTTSYYCRPDFYLLRYYGCPSTPVINALTIIGLILYIVSFAPGLGPVPYVVTSEIFPLWARSIGISCAMSINFIVNLILSITFLHSTRLLTKAGWFGLSAAISLLGWIFFYFFLPETKGIRLEHITKVLSKSNDIS